MDSILLEDLFPILAGLCTFWAIFYASSNKPPIHISNTEKTYLLLEIATTLFLRATANSRPPYIPSLDLVQLRTIAWTIVTLHLTTITLRQIYHSSRKLTAHYKNTHWMKTKKK